MIKRLAMMVAFVVGHAGTAHASPVEFVWIDPAGAATFAYEDASREAARLLDEAGVVARWRQGAPSQALRADEIAVVLLPTNAPHSRGDRRIMGSAQRGEDAVAAVWVYVREVRSTVGLERRAVGTWSAGQKIDFARALGRVAAHEAIHALVPHLPHARRGLMSERIDRAALVARQITIDPETRAALRNLQASGRDLQPPGRASSTSASPSLSRDDNTLSGLYLSAKVDLLTASPRAYGPGAGSPVASFHAEPPQTRSAASP